MAYWPIAPGKALWESKYYSRKPSRTREVFAAHYSLALNRDTIAEDNLCMQQQQAAMETGGKAFIQFGEQEIACSHFAAVWEAVSQIHSGRRTGRLPNNPGTGHWTPYPMADEIGYVWVSLNIIVSDGNPGHGQ